jgi:DNA replication protein DnaC
LDESEKAGFSVYFINAGNLIGILKKANKEGLLEKKLRDLFDEEGVIASFN